MSEAEIEAFKDHNNRFIDYIKKTDMIEGNYYIHMYNNFNASQYSFTEFTEIKATKDSAQNNPQAQENKTHGNTSE